ncbi:MAG: phosphopantetheine-binding protein [Candidatus Kapabacteria bacterium]|jgi:acyl carrier protein|nr:phosphopantetheine-binding protein [Candidatus Kapabacteria bacterium]
MTNKDILTKLKDIIEDINPDIDFSESLALIQSGAMDSLEVINYLTQIEEVFNLEISLEQLQEEKLGVVGNMLNYIASQII